MNPSVTVGRLFERLREPLQLEQLGGQFGHDRTVANSDISSPGLALAGFVARFVSERPQVLGETEMTYLASLTEEERRRHLELFL
ncbi:MAG: HPr(Ser) kinase/phosphatase, partial [Gemmatimonadaceae bacterium]